jgi:CubicO group peptidase (beta-lactamase class C family)
MKKVILLLVFAAFFTSCEQITGVKETNAPKPEIYSSRMATVLDSLRYAMGFPALSCAIVTDTGITEAEAAGCRRYGGAKNVTVDDKFQLGSCTKSFTAVLMGILVDEGLISWNTPLSKIFPEFDNSMIDQYRIVTVSHLLAHCAGFMRDPIIKPASASVRQRRYEITGWALKQAPAKQIGEYLYSNLGYIIAGAVIEKLTNKTYEEVLTEKVLIPLGLTSAGFGVPGTEGLEDQPLQHTAAHAPVRAVSDAQLDPFYNPAGGLYMSVKDWGKYVQWVLTAETGKNQKLLKNETAKMITSPQVDIGNGEYYAFGWGISNADWAGGKTLSHSGSTGFNYATAVIAVPKKYAILLMSNQGAIGSEWTLGPAFERMKKYYIEKN